MESDAIVHGDTAALQAKLAFIEEKVYTGIVSSFRDRHGAKSKGNGAGKGESGRGNVGANYEVIQCISEGGKMRWIDKAPVPFDNGPGTKKWRLVMDFRWQGARVLSYFLVLVPDKVKALKERDSASRVMVRLSIGYNEKKGQWEPTRLVEHLGLEEDLQTGHLRVIPARLQKIHQQAKELLSEASTCNHTSQ
ncbi:hypothetical protein CYMTET_19141 [Cymbomonas tetramitiformis]|uniref:Uncharacterized protein n=1 Tax=Cymbomonas tetramitiformis TaxID=36881 RepID=A0AAE0G6T5_9CHLO|nr:hypothetical protein CYMTET_19141 [Cymbomonas tetramitiformis]|eukprot:gene1858-biopygen1734